MRHLRNSGFSEVIDLNADPDEKLAAKEAGIFYHGLKIEDEDPIEDWLAVLFRASEIVEAARLKGSHVFLHCTFAVGRSPTVAMAYLITNGHSVDEAIDLVKRKRPETWNLGNPVAKYQSILNRFSIQLAAQKGPAG